MSRYRLVLFDLDGTLADTAPDLGFSLNVMLEARGLPRLDPSKSRPYASAGTRGLLLAGFGVVPEDGEYPGLRDEFLEIYALNLTRSTTLFPGVAQMLDRIESEGLSWGIVTNKPHRFTVPVLQALHLAERAACVVSGDTTPHPKPHPAPLLMATKRLGIPASASLYVGDDERDVRAARAAKIDVIVALYGYLGTGAPPHTWGADGAIREPADLADAIGLGAETV